MLISFFVTLAHAELPQGDLLQQFGQQRSQILHSNRILPTSQPQEEPMGWDIAHYHFRLHFHPDRQEVEGTVSIQANKTTGGPFTVHAGGPQISSIHVNDQMVDWHNRSDSITFPTPDEESITVEAQWTSQSNRSEFSGLIWENNVIYSQSQPESARKWLIAYDNPADKATLSWQIIAPSNLIVAAN